LPGLRPGEGEGILKKSLTLTAGIAAVSAVTISIALAGGGQAAGAETPMAADAVIAADHVAATVEPLDFELTVNNIGQSETLVEPEPEPEPLSEMDLLLQYYGYSHEASLAAVAQRPATGARQISADGLDLIKFFEGYSATGYLLGDGRCTIGWGHTVPEEELPGAECEAWTITEEEAAQYLLEHVEFFEASVDSYFTRELTQHQFDALVSFSYNVGEAYLKYGWSKAPTDEYFSKTMMLYVKPAQFTEGLTIRRTAEVELFNSHADDEPIRGIMEKLAVQRWEREQRLAAEAAAGQ